MGKTPLQKIQDEAAATFIVGIAPANREAARAELDRKLVQAFDAGIQAVRELDSEIKDG